MKKKNIINEDRLREIPNRFSWVDHRLIHDQHLQQCSPNALALYLVLVTVGDRHGISYYSDRKLCEQLPLDRQELRSARSELRHNGLISWEKPIYQVLSLDPRHIAREEDQKRRVGTTMSLGEALQHLAKETKPQEDPS